MSDTVGGTAVHVQAPRGLAARATAGIARRPLFLNDIRDRAYAKWAAAGRPAGDATRFWLEAEQEMREGR